MSRQDYLNEFWDKPWTEFATTANPGDRLDHIDLFEDDDPGFFAEMPDMLDEEADQHVTVGHTNYLDWYVEGGHVHAEELDGNGWLTDAAQQRIKQFYLDLLRTERYGVTLDDDDLAVNLDVGGDDPNYTVELYIDVTETVTTGEVFERKISPFFAAMTNSNDWGTFMHPYIFTLPNNFTMAD